MSNKFFKMFSNDSSLDEDIPMIEKKDPNIIDKGLMDYIIDEFPEVAGEIMDALVNLRDTIERSIDHIEDKACETIKASRDFERGGKYRETSIKLHERSREITEFVEWMEEEDKDIKKNIELKKQSEEKVQDEIKGINDEEDDAEKEVACIVEDFTAKQPISFKLEKHNINVESWDDMIVKTADILTRYYKHNRNSTIKTINSIKPITKKSKQNDLRDTIIDMLLEYNINLNKYEVQIK